MKTMNMKDMLQALSKATRKPHMLLSWNQEADFENFFHSVPYLPENDAWKLFWDGQIVIPYKSERTMNRHLEATLGDGSGAPVEVYALTCNAKGKLVGENT
jgi:hypothetical protein